MDFGERLPIIPWHPGGRIVAKLLGVSLQLGHIVKGVGAIQPTGVDETHEEIAHLRPVHCSVEKCDFSVQD